jgi:hypothetical protein
MSLLRIIFRFFKLWLKLMLQIVKIQLQPYMLLVKSQLQIMLQLISIINHDTIQRFKALLKIKLILSQLRISKTDKLNTDCDLHQ